MELRAECRRWQSQGRFTALIKEVQGAVGTRMKGPSSIRDGAGGKEKDSWVSKKRFKGVNLERESGKIILGGQKSKCRDVWMKECVEGLDNS